MNIDGGKQPRATLKSYFVKNAIPTQDQFAQLMDSVLNQRDDGLVKAADGPLSIAAVGDDTSFKKVLDFYTLLSDSAPTWTLSLRPRSDPTNSQTGRAALSFNDSNGNSRLAIDTATGNVGIGPLAIGPWPNNHPYAFFGTSTLDNTNDNNYALLQSSAGVDLGRTFLNSPLDIRFRVLNKDYMILDKNGNVGISTTEPSARLDVNGDTLVRGNLTVNTRSLLAEIDRITGRITALETTIGQHSSTGTYVLADQYLHLRGAGDENHVLRYADQFAGQNVNGPALYGYSGGVLGTVSGTLPNQQRAALIWHSDGQVAIQGQLEVKGEAQKQDQFVFRATYSATQNRFVELGSNLGSVMINNQPFTPSGDTVHGSPNLWLDADTTVYIKQGSATFGHDVAERFPAAEPVRTGAVVVFDPALGAVTPCECATDKRVVGIVSAAPAFILGVEIDGPAIALCGRVPCKVDADIAPIAPGDLLTTSRTRGHAQKAEDPAQAVGAIIGKALEARDSGRGEILVLVIMQ